jgi:hypothetical protein
LLAAIRPSLGEDRAKPLVEVITHQAARAPNLFRDEIKDAVVDYATALASLTPASESDGETTMRTAAQCLTKYVAELL